MSHNHQAFYITQQNTMLLHITVLFTFITKKLLVIKNNIKTSTFFRMIKCETFLR